MNMKAGIILVVIAIILVGLGFYFFSASDSSVNENNNVQQGAEQEQQISDQGNQNNPNNEINQVENQTEEPASYKVTITSSGFSPSTLSIKQGDTIIFTNKQSSLSWPASAVHPTHTVYPGSDIDKCGTAEEQNNFDACSGLNLDETYTFTFNEKGSWGYHDHLNPGLRGTIVVE